MLLPLFYRQPSFSVAELAEIAEVSEDTLRTWLARNVTDYTGHKSGHRLWFRARDAYFVALLRDLVGYGVGVRTAMHSAARLADDAQDFAPIVDECLVVWGEGSNKDFRLISLGEMV